MDEFVYACPSHGTVAVLAHRELMIARPPWACPWCQGPLNVERRQER